MKAYFIHCPGMVYAVTEYGRNKAEAVDRFRQRNGLIRMPAGHAVWPA